MNVNTEISVSQKEKLDCEKLAKFLGKFNIFIDATPNISMLPDKEYGCRLRTTVQKKEDIQHIWNLLRNEYNFGCAHLVVGNRYTGCILDYLRPTLCIGTPNNILPINSSVIHTNPEFEIKTYT